MPAFRPYSQAEPAKVEDHDTLDTIAERARAEGKDVSADDISLFNWGTKEPAHVQELMRDELGARARISPMEYALMPGDEPREALRVPDPFAQDGFATERTHTLHIRRKSCPEQFIGCCSLPSITFPFDSSFIRPEVADSLAVQGVDLERLRANDLFQATAGRDFHRMSNAEPFVLLFGSRCPVILAPVQFLNLSQQRTAERNIEFLHAPADRKDRNAALDRAFQKRQCGCVAVGVIGAVFFGRCLSI